MAEELDHAPIWARVPHGSTLSVSVTGTTETESLVATIDGLSSDNKKKLKQLNTLTGAPFEMTVDKGRKYSIDLILLFETSATASVKAEIRKPNGERHGDAFNPEFRGRKGAEEVFSLFIFAERV